MYIKEEISKIILYWNDNNEIINNTKVIIIVDAAFFGLPKSNINKTKKIRILDNCEKTLEAFPNKKKSKQIKANTKP